MIGQGLPAVVAVVAIPRLLVGLGPDRFGVVLISWTLMGYFGLFDFGIGSATTKYVAEIVETGRLTDLHELLASSLAINIALGAGGGSLLALLTPWLVRSGLNVPVALQPEVRGSFYLLALSVPVVVLTSSARGVLEALHRFDLTNAVRLPASVLNYLAPLAVLRLSGDLRSVIAAIVTLRVLTLSAYLWLGRKCLPRGGGGSRSNFSWSRTLLGFGGWVIVSTVVLMAVASIDRLVIGSLISLAAVTYYSTPYEMVTRLWILSGSLLGVLFPVFSALGAGQPAELSRLGRRAVRFLLISIIPVVGILLAFAHEVLALWLGEAFAVHSTAVTRWLVLGIIFSVLAQVPLTILQGVGRADLCGELQLVLLACYIPTVWVLARSTGILGVGIAWAVRAALECILLFAVQRRVVRDTSARKELRRSWKWGGVPFVFILLTWLSPQIAPALLARLLLTVALLIALCVWFWLALLDAADRLSVQHLLAWRISRVGSGGA
jgi:O-antigen/teichoic acid export membrane protein